MDKFDTHGGHYEPQGYMRVNAGGSHDENPNGGVQVGVDPEGTPNLLEEGEPVYNDYVYSDNITAEEDILKKHNIPSKYSGKLYSEIADSFVDEVAEMPLDPIANNGLNAMLVRLAESQEEQKSIQQQRELEDELSKLSPEELDELEQMLSEQEMVQSQENPEADVPEMVQEPVENQGVVPQVPMMATGGNLFRFGNPLDRTHYRSVQWPYSNAYNQFNVPLYDGTDEPITPILEGGQVANGYNTDARYVLGPQQTKATTSGTATTRHGTLPRYPLYQMSEEELNAIEAEADRGLQRGYERLPLVTRLNSIIPGLGRRDENGEVIMYGRPAEKGLAQANLGIIPTPKKTTLNSVAASPAKPAKTSEVSDTGMLPTWPRYAGAVTSGLLGLYNAFQEPDKYTISSYTPVLPQGRMHLIDPVYNPIDQNQIVNDVLASSSGTTRAINNSGLGAATQATLLAQDYNTGRNLGTALTQAREANNQRMNQVIAQRNQNASTLGNFNYGQSRDRAQILNDAAVRNLQNDILRQRLNYEAEGQKYAAIQQQIDSVAQALSNIGRENAAMNMINGDEAYAYALNRLFDPYYKGHITKCGGPIKKTKK